MFSIAKRLLSPIAALLLSLCAVQITPAADTNPRLAELDAFWNELSRTVREGDFEGMKATYHDDAVLVSLKTTTPIANALAKWKAGLDETKAGKRKASVQFRFSKRVGDATTAYETGIFLYATIGPDGKTEQAYVHFEELLVKKGTWKTMMEFQKNEATQAEWNALK